MCLEKKNKEMIEITRNLTDWKTLALKVKARGSPLFYALENEKFVENSKKVARSLGEVNLEELENQFSKFLDRLYKEFEDKTLDAIKEADSKTDNQNIYENSCPF